MLKFLAIIIISLALLVPASALAQNQSRYIPLTFRDTITGDIVSPLPFVGGIPVCHDPLFEAGVLGTTCYDEADPIDPEDYRPIVEECEEVGGYSLSKGSYIENGAIVGSPCDPVGFCSNPNTNDPVVRDHCEDIWTDTDDDIGSGEGNGGGTNSKYVGSDPNDDCDAECEMLTRHLENEDRLRESIREGEQEQEESEESEESEEPEVVID